MKIIEITHPGTPAKDDPEVLAAMQVWDGLSAAEQRQAWCSLNRAILAHEQTGGIEHLVRFAASIKGMAVLEATTNLRGILRARRAVTS